MKPIKFVAPYIEELISKLAQDETGKRQHYRPVYSLHKWWARRPGALFRSLILLATQPEKPLFNLMNGQLTTWQSNYFLDHNLEDIIIFDPFMGGGTTLVEANRLGAKVIGCDLNPVSYWIVRETLKSIDLNKLEQYLNELQETSGQQIKALFKTRCTSCQQEADTLYAFWVRSIPCPHCQNEVHLFKRTLLNEGLSRTKPVSPNNPATAFCPHCFSLNEWNGQGVCQCQTCQQVFDPRSNSYDKGSFDCPHCHKQGISLLKSLGNDQKLKEKLVAIEYLCPCNQVRTYKAPDASDLALLATIEDKVQQIKTEMILPQQEILIGDSSERWRNHNYRYYHEVFSPRQLLAFHYLLTGIKGLPDPKYRHAFFTIFSNSLEYNNMMTPYNYPHRKLHHLFNYHALPLTTTPVENVVWGVGSEGAGTFLNCYQRYVNAKRYNQKPFDRFKDAKGNIQTIPSEREKIEATLVTNFQELQNTNKSALLFCGDSAHLSDIPDESVNFVITDPPYFDSIHYSELSNFFYVWLRCLIDDKHFVDDHVPTEQEAIVNTSMDKGEKEYQELLSGVFQEAARVLRPEGKLIFTFHHTKWRAWWTVLQALVESGFILTNSFPVMSEYKVNPHIRNKQSLDMDLVLICQKKTGDDSAIDFNPAAILHRAMNHLNGNLNGTADNHLFLYFMGELLRTASLLSEKEGLNYDWFAESLTHFDDYLESIQWQRQETAYVDQARQLRLLELDDEKN